MVHKNWPHLLLIGAGDIGRRILRDFAPPGTVTAVTSTAANVPALKALGARVVRADLDKAGTLARLPRDWRWLLHCAPPPGHGRRDTRTRNLLRTLGRARRQRQGKSLARIVVYLSTSGVYGDCRGALVTEARPVRPESARAQRRVDAEQALVRAARRSGTRLVILRVPGIYAGDRLPLARLRAGTPAIISTEDAYTNHVHADDLAAIAVRAMLRAARRVRPAVRVYNCNDNSTMKMGDWFDLVADACGLPAPPR
ncbi:MAG: NAD-dependent epimerase/dehydratase family protein, partial [Burkholderiales bacterium]|nr:NAD-dependent epimerase/dehydratase family protein [Burkholderiales bacterium]